MVGLLCGTSWAGNTAYTPTPEDVADTQAMLSEQEGAYEHFYNQNKQQAVAATREYASFADKYFYDTAAGALNGLEGAFKNTVNAAWLIPEGFGAKPLDQQWVNSRENETRFWTGTVGRISVQVALALVAALVALNLLVACVNPRSTALAEIKRRMVAYGMGILRRRGRD